MTDFATITAKLDCPHEVIGPCLLIQADCLKVLPLLEVGSVDAVVTDPPYGHSWSGVNSTANGGRNWTRRRATSTWARPSIPNLAAAKAPQ